MALRHLLEGGHVHLWLRSRGTRGRHARKTVVVVPVLSCMPAIDVWFFRLALAFLVHLEAGGHVVDRLRGRVVGNPSGRPFNFDNVSGGPLLWAPNLVRSGHLFVGRAICPGFMRIAARIPWWQGTNFCARGHDYFHDGYNYGHVPVDVAPHAYARVAVDELDDAAWTKPAQRAVLVYCDPLKQALEYFKTHGLNQHTPAYGAQDRRVKDWTFRDYLFERALPSYAKLLVTYQAMAAERPHAVRLVPDWQFRGHPTETLASMLSHLSGTSGSRTMLEDAMALARPQHVEAVERELGRPLDRSRRRHRRRADTPPEVLRDLHDPGLRREALDFLASLGIDPACFAPSFEESENTASLAVA